MYPLLERDGLLLPYVALWLIWGSLMWAWAPHILQVIRSGDPDHHHPPSSSVGQPKQKAGFAGWMVGLFGCVFVVGVVACHVAKEWVEPPPHLPWLYDRLFVTLGFVGLALTMLHLQVAQWRLAPQVTYKWNEQERTKIKKAL